MRDAWSWGFQSCDGTSLIAPEMESQWSNDVSIMLVVGTGQMLDLAQVHMLGLPTLNWPCARFCHYGICSLFVFKLRWKSFSCDSKGNLAPVIPTMQQHLPHCTKEEEYQHQCGSGCGDWTIFVLLLCMGNHTLKMILYHILPLWGLSKY